MILKPPKGVLLNRGHPLARGLVGSWLMNEGGGNTIQDLSGNGNICTVGSSVLWDGDAIEGNGDTNSNILLSATLTTTPNFTVVVDWAWDVVSDIAFGGVGYDVGGYGILILDANRVYTSADGSYKTITVNGAFTAPQRAVLAFTKNGTLGTWYKNGVALGSNNTFTAANVLKIQSISGYAGGANTVDGKLYYAYVFNRDLSVSEIAQLYREPFAMFEQENSPLFVAATSGGGAPVGNAGIMTTNTGFWGATY